MFNKTSRRKQGLGLFHRIPYEVRELIWLEFIPAGEGDERYNTKQGAQATDLRILRTSKAIYNEVSKLLYEFTSLIFTLDPLRPGLNVSFEQMSHSRRMDGALNCQRTLWHLEDINHARSSGFCDLPFHKFWEVVVDLRAPNASNRHELFFLWKDVTQLMIPIIKETVIDSLTIRLQKGVKSDWLNESGRPNKISVYQVINCRHDYDVVTVPFFALRNLKDISVETHSWQLRREMDWRVINKGMETVLHQSWKHCESPIQKDYGILEHDVDRAVAGDYFWLHLEMWKTRHPIYDRLRRDFLSQWFDENENSEFERQIQKIVYQYPEIIETYDPQMNILEDMHMTLVSLYSYAKSMRGEEDLSYWDQGIWYSTFPLGVPTQEDYRFCASGGFYTRRRDLFKLNAYLKHTKENDYLSTMTDVIIDWRMKKGGNPLRRCPSCD
ncbi:hypothetical protein DTO271G3_3148 [Paecilomyces variotii]|nr:hypothetical protein DTO271G3_3148 [Paecilomyces variotii]